MTEPDIEVVTITKDEGGYWVKDGCFPSRIGISLELLDQPVFPFARIDSLVVIWANNAIAVYRLLDRVWPENPDARVAILEESRILETEKTDERTEI